MPQFVCPGCRADLEPDLIEKTGRAECPFCGADVSGIGLPTADPSAVESFETAADSRLVEGRDDAGNGGAVSRSLPPIPEKSRIRVIESTPDRLVLFIPGGGRQSGGIGCFAIAWNGFMTLFTGSMLAAGPLKDDAGNPAPLYVVIPFLSLFWGIGLAFAFFWLKFKFERTFLLLDRERIVIQKTLFNKKRLTDVPLGPDSCAELVEAYQQNDTPVYRIEVRGVSGTAKFGTALGEQEKDWVVDRVNEFLGVPGSESGADEEEPAVPSQSLVFPNECTKCGAPLEGPPVDGALKCAHCNAVHRGAPAESAAEEPSAAPKVRSRRLTPESLPPGSTIRVLESNPEKLVIRTGLPADSPMRWVIPLFMLPFAIGWYSFIGFFIWNAIGPGFGWFGVFHLLFMIPFVAAGLMPLGIGIYALAGSTTVSVTSERIACRWGVGPIGYSRSLPAKCVESVRLEELQSKTSNRRIRGSRGGSTATGIGSRQGVARGAGKMLPLTIFEDTSTAEQVVALVRTKLEALGHPVSDA